MRDLDHLGVLPAVPDQQALLGEAIDERPRLVRNFVARRHATHELAGRVDLGEMRNEGRARELEPLLFVFRRLALGDGLGVGLRRPFAR